MDELAGVQDAPCQVRPGEPCRLCMPGATGPQDCGLVYLVRHDPDLRDELARLWAELGAEAFWAVRVPGEVGGEGGRVFAESEGVVSPEHVGWKQG